MTAATGASIAAEEVLVDARCDEDVVARGFELPAQMRQIDREAPWDEFHQYAGDRMASYDVPEAASAL
jgi:hypothetical protein